jgi:4-hydroxybenzoate polyprenyltransferase
MKNIISKIAKLSFKGAKSILVWFGKAIKESIAQVWTLLGFFIAWLTLTGTAQQIVGIATLVATAIWLITIPLREEKE